MTQASARSCLALHRDAVSASFMFRNRYLRLCGLKRHRSRAHRRVAVDRGGARLPSLLPSGDGTRKGDEE